MREREKEKPNCHIQNIIKLCSKQINSKLCAENEALLCTILQMKVFQIFCIINFLDTKRKIYQRIGRTQIKSENLYVLICV